MLATPDGASSTSAAASATTPRFADGGARHGRSIAPRSIELRSKIWTASFDREFHVMDGERLAFPDRSLRPRLLPVRCSEFTPIRTMLAEIHPRSEARQTPIIMTINRHSSMPGHTRWRRSISITWTRRLALHHRRVSQDARNVLFGRNNMPTVPVKTKVRRGLKVLCSTTPSSALSTCCRRTRSARRSSPLGVLRRRPPPVSRRQPDERWRHHPAMGAVGMTVVG